MISASQTDYRSQQCNEFKIQHTRIVGYFFTKFRKGEKNGDRSLIFKPFRITRFKKRKKTFDIWRGSGKYPLPKRRLGLAWFNGSHGDVVNSKGFVRSKSGCLNLKSNRSKYGCLISVIRLIVFLSPLEQIDLSIKRVFLFRN